MPVELGERVRATFDRMKTMETLGAELLRVEPGVVEIEFPFRAEFTQQHGFMHAGIVTTVVDTACGYAAYTLMPPDASVLTVEFKVNFLAPARGRRFRARGTVVKAGKTLSVCHGEVFALSEDGEKLIVNMSATMMTVRNVPDVTPG